MKDAHEHDQKDRDDSPHPADDGDLLLHRFHIVHPEGEEHIERVTDENDDKGELPVPPPVFPNQRIPAVEYDLDNDAQDRVQKGEEDPVVDSKDLHRLVLGEYLGEEDSRESEPECDFDIQAHGNDIRRIRRRRPNGGVTEHVQEYGIEYFQKPFQAVKGQARQ